MRKILALVILFVTCSTAKSQEFAKSFSQLFTADDTTALKKLLAEWEMKNSNDPELYIAYFNYYTKMSRNSAIVLDNQKHGDDALTVSDTGTGKTVGYISEAKSYNLQILQKGFSKIDKGISLFPSRLDMRFGKIYMFGECENFSEFTKEIVKTIDYSNKINYKWSWKDGKPLEDAKQFFLSSIQTYVTTIYDKNDNSILPFMRQIAETILKYNPNHVESLSNVAITYMVVGEYAKALSYLLKAEKVAPTDVVVLNNIAEVYKRKKDKVNAIAYYQKVIAHGNNDEIQYAQNQLNSLK